MKEIYFYLKKNELQKETYEISTNLLHSRHHEK